MKGVLAFFAVFFLGANGDEFYYNVRNWASPMLRMVSDGAHNGMAAHERLPSTLTGDQMRLLQLEEKIREKVGYHLQSEMTKILDELQGLISIVTKFSLDVGGKFREVSAKISTDDGVAEKEANGFVDFLVGRARAAIFVTVQKLNYDVSSAIEDHLSAKVFQSLAVRIARDVLEGAELPNIQRNVLAQIRAVLEQVFTDKTGEIEEELMTDVLEELRASLVEAAAVFHGQEEKFERWMTGLIQEAVKGANPQISLVHQYAKRVINDACKLARDTCETAYNFFAVNERQIGSAWERIQTIVSRILEEDNKI